MQSANAVLPETGFAAERLLAPHQAIVAFFLRVGIAPPAVERIGLGDALGRVLSTRAVADDDYPNADRSLMDGFALCAQATPGEFAIVHDVRMGTSPDITISRGSAAQIATGGVLPRGSDAVVPVEDVRRSGDSFSTAIALQPGENVVARGADMRRGDIILSAPRRVRAPEIGVLATLGFTTVEVFARPVIAVFSSGDELVDPSVRPGIGQVRDSNRHVVAASLQAMGATPRHYPTLRDEAPEFESALQTALKECDAVVVTGGSSVGERDRLPRAVESIASPGIVVRGLRVKPGKPTLLAADGGKPILGLPGNPTSAVMMLQAVAAPIVGALCGMSLTVPTLEAKLCASARSRAGWTWYVPVRLHENGGTLFAEPLPLGSFSVSLTARADGYIVMGEREEELAAGTSVTVTRLL